MATSNTTYTLTMTENQARQLAHICEFYARIVCGQWNEIVWACIPISDPDFRRKLDAMEPFLLKARKIAYPDLHGMGHSYGIGKFDHADISWDIYQVIRHAITWHNHPKGGITVNFDKPMQTSTEPLAKCQVTTK